MSTQQAPQGHPTYRPTPTHRPAAHITIATSTALAIAIGALLLALRRIQTLQALLTDAHHDAQHDRLTGLPNRRAALTHLTEHPVALAGLLDLDDFKTINDRHGHHVGDQLLITLAHRMSTALGQDGTAYRLAGDEFLLLWHQPPADPAGTAATILTQIQQPLTLQGHALQPTASLGLALPGPHLAGTDLIAAADAAMYDAKTQNSGVSLYAQQHPPAPTDRRIPDRRTTRSTTNHRGTMTGTGHPPTDNKPDRPT